MPEHALSQGCRVAVIWIDWYPYHVARFRGIDSVPMLKGHAVGIELVGGIGVHAGLKFREDLPENLAIETLMPGTSWRDANKFTLARELWQRLTSLDPQVVLIPGYYTLPAIAAALWARLHGAAGVLMTESTAIDHARTGWKERIKSLGMRVLFDWAVTGGKAHVEYLRQLGFPEDRIAGFYDVVDNEMFSEGTFRMRSSVSPGSAQKSVLYVGRLAPEKNVATLLESWIEYRNSGGTWPLVLVGDGPEARTLKAAAAACPFAADVHFPGLKSSQELFPYYASAGVFVLPSTREPWGLVVNEAMASHLPVLVSDRCGCAVDLVKPEVNGFIFDPLDGAALTLQLRRMEQMTQVEFERMSAASAEIIRGFSPRNFGASVASIASVNRSWARMQTAPGGAQ